MRKVQDRHSSTAAEKSRIDVIDQEIYNGLLRREVAISLRYVTSWVVVETGTFAYHKKLNNSYGGKLKKELS